MPEPITRSFSLMRLTKPSSPIRRFPSIYEIDGARVCDRVPLLLQECWVYRNPLRVHSRAEEPYCDRVRWNESEMWKLWNRRQSTKFNGVSYIVQRGPRRLLRADRRKSRRSSASIWKMPRLFERLTAGLAVYGRECALRLGENAQ